ncbi:oxygen-regulated protein 1-like [Hippoglossus stenolepis]|uniref:oxygen-regulated protein 1-like n=1 Tax=Hippoglossus stenolepis TaxID=195615 RepID=UPI001FAFAE4D|nr:oxygen-regulated protein 1-like [Hippoglossus stenolepis]
MNQTGLRRIPPDQSSGSGHTFGTPRHPRIKDPILSKRVCFYKSGDPQFSGLRMVINNRTFKTFDALLDSLSKKVPLPFGVRNITTPRGIHAIYTLDELEDGKSYICSDRRKVTPINLALARKKLPPWYHARPATARRRVVQQARSFPGRNVHRQEPVVVRTPKKLLVFCNGEPTLKRKVVLHKRTSANFESILEYISELMQFHVVKLHTPDGRRVDGLPGLILCSGTVVAAGREPFKSANYTSQKSPAPTQFSNNRKRQRRSKSLNRKKKSRSYHSSKSRNFSLSSERYIVNRIHNSMAGSSYDGRLPTNPSNSLELESVAGTDGAEGQGCLPPADDDIEKSFRVNQDGSMTVEMKVRLTLKEEETIHWTTTLSRSNVASELNGSCLPEPVADEEICSPASDPVDLQTAASSIDSINKDKTKDNNDEDPPSPSNGAFNRSRKEEDITKVQTHMLSPTRAPTPGYKEIRKKQASVESVISMTADGIQEGVVGSYSYKEQTENRAMTEQYCVVKQTNTRPVPKPRRLGDVDNSNIKSRNISSFKSSEILQIESSGEEVTETVLHIYEQQMCQDNFLANICAHDIPPYGRPATSETGQFSSNNEFDPEFWRPSTASESISIWKTENMSLTSDLTLSSLKTGATQATNNQQQLSKSTRGKDKPEQRELNKGKRKPKAGKKRARRLLTPGKRQKQNSSGFTEMRGKAKTFSSAGFIKRVYGNKSKSPKNKTKATKRATQNGDGSVTTKSSQSTDATIKWNLKIPNVPSPPKENQSETVSIEASRLDISSTEVSPPRGALTRQTSVHQEKKNENKPCDISKSKTLSSSGTNEYVQKWLEKAHINATSGPDEDGKKSEAHIRNQDSESGYNQGLVEEKSEIQPSQFLRSEPLRTSVKLRVKCFENQLSNPSGEKAATQRREEIAPCNSTTTSTKNCTSVAQRNTGEVSPLVNGTCSERNPSPIKISLQKATPYSTISMELLPPPPPPDELAELNAECCMMDVSSAASSPLYRLSSVSSQMSDNHPLSISPTSDKASSPTGRTMETVQGDAPSALRELARAPSVKRAPLVSNLSLERQMSLRKASLSKYTSCAEDTTASNTAGDDANTVLPNGLCSTGTHLPLVKTQKSNSSSDLKNSPSLCTSASSTSLTSGERMSSCSISLSETPTPSDAQFTETKPAKTAQKEAASPKPLVKKVKIITSPSQNRKSQSKKLPFDSSHDSPQLSSSLREQHSNKTMSPNIKKRESSPAPSPSPERRKMLHKAKLQKRPSPYSQSLVMVSPPVTNMSNKKKLSRNLSTDYASEPENNTKRKTSSRRKRHQTSQAINSAAEQDETPTTLETNQTERKKTDQEKSVTQTQLPQLNIANQPNTRPVLEQICRSIKSIRQITQNQHSSCVEKSNSPPDFSSHVASTFGSSSKALLAFLSIMTLNEGINISDRDQLNANVSCAEALKMIDSLREIANIEDSQKIKASLCNLQRSTSQQLLQSWRGFQELSDKCKSCSLTPNDSQELIVNKVIDQIIDNLDIPKKLKEELMSLSERVDEGSMSTRFIEKAELSQKENRDSKMSHCSGEAASVSEDEKTNVDVRSMIKKFANVNQPKQSEMHDIPLRTESLKHKPPAELKDKQVTEETQLHRHIEDKLSQETANMSISSTKTPEVARRKLQMQSEGSTSIPESGHTTDEESGAGEEGRNASSISKDEESCRQSLCSSDAGEGHSCLDEEEQTQQSSNYYVELSVRKESVSSPDSRNLRLSEEERPEEPEIQNPRQGTEISVDESAGYSDADEPTTSEEEQLEFERNELKVRSEESLSGIEEEKESIDEEAQLNYRPDPEEVKWNKLQALIGEVEEISSEDEDPKNDHSSLLNSDSLAERERFSADEHGRCEEQVEMEQANTAREQIRSSSEEELSFCEKESSSEKEEHRETPVAKDRMVVEKVKLESEEIISQSVAERIILLEKQVADAQKRKSVAESPALKHVPQRNVHLESDVEESPSESLCTRSAPQSSLSFSYDSSGVITTEPEGNRVRSIREMFLAKSATDNRQGRQRFQSPNPSDLSELRADTSTSAGYQSQTSIELSSGEDDSARKSITKGFVRRTIERLYGKKDPEEKASERPPSAPKQKKKEHSSIFSPFHSARTKAMTELSYFNSTNVLDSLTEATGCIAFNAQVGPGDSVPNDNGPWLLRENTLIRKSVSEPVAINKILANTPPDEEMCEGREQNAPNPLDSTTSEPEDKIKSLSRKCTYFSLPHASDSDVCQDDTRPASKNSVSGDSIAIDTSENAKTWGERNGILPAGGITDFRMMDNKVHPLPEVPSDGEVVVVQPGRGQGVMNRRLQEPDVLDLLYNFCGEHCPIL